MNDTSQRELWSMDSDQRRKESLQILSSAIALLDKDPRMETPLADFSTDYAKGWHMAVGTYFRDALEIKQTPKVTEESKTVIWTQGGTFSFSQGDILYDTPLAYQQWDAALQHIQTAYQVLENTASRPEKQQVYFRKNPSYTGSLAGERNRGNISRREAILKVTPTEWTEEDKLGALVKSSTQSYVSPGLLDMLCDLGAMERKVEVVAPRFPGHIKIKIMVPNSDRSALCAKNEMTMSQDEFVELLISGKRPEN